MTDSKLKSATEAGINIAIGYWINYASNVFILPHFADSIAKGDLVAFHYIGIIYTGISLARQYGFRRLFNKFGPNENAYTLLQRVYKRLVP